MSFAQNSDSDEESDEEFAIAIHEVRAKAQPQKRPRSDEWVRFEPSEECKHLDDGRKVFFVDGNFDNFPNDAQKEWSNPESSSSLCTQYLEWLYPDTQFEVTSSTLTKYIDLWERGGDVYLFRAPGFFYFSNPQFLPEFGQFDRADYGVDFCMQHGAFSATTMQIIAFYYTKILPARFKKSLYIHKTDIRVPFFDGANVGQVDALTENVQAFLAATPDGSLGIAFVYLTRHVMLLVFDTLHKRLELYDSNGRFQKYHRDVGHAGPLQSFTFYQYLKDHAFEMHEVMLGRITKIWGNTFKFQQQDSSCSLWASTVAICRMTGTSRERLPTKTQDVIDITSLNRQIMWHACWFSRIPDGSVSFEILDRILNICKVPQEEADKLLSMVTKHADNSPIPIPPDEALDPDEKELEPAVCPKPLVINLKQVDVTPYFMAYIFPYCEQANVVVRGQSVPDSSAALRLILPTATSVELEMAEPINLSDVGTVVTLDRLVSENPRYQILAKEAVVFADNNLDLVKRMRGRLYFDRILRAKPMSAEADEAFVVMTDELVNDPQPWVLIVNLLNVGAMRAVWALRDDSVDRLICTGPLVGQEPTNYNLNLLMRKSAHVQVPSAGVKAVVRVCEETNGRTLHVTEVETSLSLIDVLSATQLASCVGKGLLTMDRLVLQFAMTDYSVTEVNKLVQEVNPQTPIYMVINPVDEKSIDLHVKRMNVRNFILDRRYESDPPLFLTDLQARSVIYRDFYVPHFAAFKPPPQFSFTN